MKKMALLFFLVFFAKEQLVAQPFQPVRIPTEKRHFSSSVIEAKIAEMQIVLKNNPELAWLFTNCIPNTLDTTHKDNPEEYTRPWFAWANTLFGEFMIKVQNVYPELL